MKRFLILGILGTLVLALIAYNTPDAQDAYAQAAPTATPRATRIRKPKPPVATPAPADVASADAEDNAEISPSAPGAMTSTIVVFNPDTSGAATVQIDIYDGTGSVAYTTTETVNANGAKLVTLPASLGSNFQGSATVSSDKNVQVLALAANGNNTARDAYEGLSAPAANITLPLARHLALDTQNSILAIQNTTASAADVTITFYNPDGTQQHQQVANIAAHQPFYLNTNTVFPSSTFTGSIGLASTQNIAAALQTRYYKDTAALRGLTATDADTTQYLNMVLRKFNAKGAATNWSEIFARNNGANATDITIEFFTLAGTSLGTQTAANVPVNGSAQFMLNDALFASLGTNYTGWAKITAGEPTSVGMLQVFTKGKRLTGAQALGATQTVTSYVCGDTARSTAQTSQITILNTEARNARVAVRLYDPNTGAKLAQLTVKLKANAATTVKLSDAAFVGAGNNFQGMAVVVAKGTTPPKIIASVTNPYNNGKIVGTTGYLCTAMP